MLWNSPTRCGRADKRLSGVVDILLRGPVLPAPQALKITSISKLLIALRYFEFKVI